MNINRNTSAEKSDESKKVYSIVEPKNMERCKDCPYPGVGFVCWSQDGSCMKSDMEKIDSRSRR